MKRLFRLSSHAVERLTERSRLSIDDFLALLNNGLYKSIFSKKTASLTKREADELSLTYGLEKKDLYKFSILTFEKQFEFFIVWSTVDQRPFTAVIASQSNLVVTVLNADAYESDVWKARATEEAIRESKDKLEKFQQASHENKHLEIFTSWIDADETRKTKVKKVWAIIQDKDWRTDTGLEGLRSSFDKKWTQRVLLP
jgi:hypothetical protein